MHEEEWKPVFNGDYEVSNHGRFRRKSQGRKAGRTHPGKILNLTEYRSGYVAARPVINGKVKKFYIHVLVAMEFIGPRLDGMQINHKDSNKKNNHVSNLEYVTRSENVTHGYQNATPGKRRRQRISRDVVEKIRELKQSGLSYQQIERQTGVTAIHCSRIARGISRASK